MQFVYLFIQGILAEALEFTEGEGKGINHPRATGLDGEFLFFPV